ncbi:MAG: hypothetical protein GEU90_07105 [Gemmatimonas sp.]|nr:hypothetical protein [Gemmatimonas sp.]
MIARVAESCFWLHRYMERVEATARLLGVNFSFLLDVPGDGIERWRPLLVVAGVEEEYIERVGSEYLNDEECVQEYLVWSEQNPVSAWNSLCRARESARTIRETISLEAWTTLNRFWLWMKSPESRALYSAEPSTFYERMRENCQLFNGVCNDTLLHEDPFEFMRLGMFLERGAQTARILDTKYHAVGPTGEEAETPVDLGEWIAILRSCSAYEPFFKRSEGSLTGRTVAGFLLLDPAFPRSVTHCLMRAWNFLQLIAGENSETGHRSAGLLVDLLTQMRTKTIDDIIHTGLHAELTSVVDQVTVICRAVEEDYFSGRIPGEEMMRELAIQG